MRRIHFRSPFRVPCISTSHRRRRSCTFRRNALTQDCHRYCSPTYTSEAFQRTTEKSIRTVPHPDLHGEQSTPFPPGKPGLSQRSTCSSRYGKSIISPHGPQSRKRHCTRLFERSNAVVRSRLGQNRRMEFESMTKLEDAS